MGSFLVWVLVALVAAAAGFAVVVVVTGRADMMAEMPRDEVPLDLPDDQPARAEDVFAVRFDLAFRGYRMDQVDAVLDRLAEDLAFRDRQIAELRSKVSGARDGG